MTNSKISRRARLGTALAALAISLGPIALQSTPAAAQAGRNYRPSQEVQLSVGEGQMVKLPRNVADVWTSNPTVADVHVTNPRQINLFGKEFGEATVIATAADGSVVYGANIRVSQNLPSINEVMRAAMPEANVRVMTIGQSAILQGTVASPEDAALAGQLALRELNPGVDFSKEGAMCKICVINRLKTATPLQVTLKVRVAEVNRSLLKQVGVNLLASTSGGFSIGIAQGQNIWLPEPGSDDTGGPTILKPSIGSAITGVGKLFGMDILSSLDLAETDGLVTTLAEPNLTALSGETASFLAGGEFPIPVSQSLGAVTIEYKQYGVGLAFTPIVLADGRISMRVRPEVSELSNEGSIRLNGFNVPALTTRRAETTVELGSGQSFMLAGLLRNTNTNSIDKAPVLGDLPILGALFRSTSFRRQETELVIIVTPYLVRPISGQMASPLNGYRAPTDAERVFEGQNYKGPSSGRSPVVYPAPGLSGAAGVSSVPAAASAPASAPAPGFKL